MTNYSLPGVYVQEISTLPPSVAQVSTAVPAFIGFTEIGKANEPVRVSSMLEFQTIFGSYFPAEFTVTVETDSVTNVRSIGAVNRTSANDFYLYYGLRHFFDNGGGSCYVVSLGAFSERVGKTETVFTDALDTIKNLGEPTLLVFPDALFLPSAKYYTVVNAALTQCADMQDRFTIIDLHPGDTPDELKTELKTGAILRSFGLTTENLKYGAAYTPFLNTSYSYEFDDEGVTLEFPAKLQDVSLPEKLRSISLNEPIIRENNSALYNQVKARLGQELVTLPPSPAMAGVYARVDRNRGVWKAPANVSLASVIGPSVIITQEQQGLLNIDPTSGKSINCIRSFTGKGTLVWGARTLAGNDNEWRYINVRRLFITIEESVEKASAFAVFEPNDANTWLKVKAMIDNYLYGLWQQGVLAGTTPESSYFVNIGLGKTMTTEDILNGYMIVEVGVAAVRPAEFIVLRFSHKLQEV